MVPAQLSTREFACGLYGLVTQITRLRWHDVILTATYQTKHHIIPLSRRRSLLIGPKAAVRGTSAALQRPGNGRYVGPLHGIQHTAAVDRRANDMNRPTHFPFMNYSHQQSPACST